MASDWKTDKISIIHSAETGLYLHIPFCERKCPYCDFNTYAGLQSIFQDTVDALCLEMKHWSAPLANRRISTIFLGGGTPTVLEDSQLGQLFETIHKYFQVNADAEITSEANPGTVDRAKFATLRALGVNRLSLGVQSLQPSELTFLGRIHDTNDVYRAVDAAREAGIENFNLDFMFGLPGQTLAAWEDTLNQAIALEPTHLSLYSLIVEPNTPLAHWVKSGIVTEPNEDEAADHYEHAMQRLKVAGFQHYEVSNWAKASAQPTKQSPNMPALASQHNLIYWRNGDYLGIGPGAHSHLRWQDDNGNTINRRWGNRKPVPGYNKRVRQGTEPEEFHEDISERTSMGETMMLGLRLIDEGVELERFYNLHGVRLESIFADELSKLSKKGLLTIDDQQVRLTPAGLMIGNQVFMEFLPND